MKNRVLVLLLILALIAPSVVAAQTIVYDHFIYLPIVSRNWSKTMRMTRFGDAYGSAYTFTDVLMEDSWGSTRPPIAQAVSGASGVFDFYGANNFPISPVTATKKFALTATTSALIEDALITLRAATIAADRSKLWWLDRDEATVYWSWAKCVALNDADSYKEKGRWLKVVELTFFMSEGLWYGDTEQSWSETMVIPASTVGRAVTGLTNDGNVNAPLDVRIVPHDSLTVEDSAAGVWGVSQWEHAADTDDGEQLFVLASKYKTVVNKVIAYVHSVLLGASFSYDAWSDGRFLYSANDTDGIHSYSVDGSGNLTHVNSDDQGDNARGVWGDGAFVYLANYTGGIHSYTVDAAGAFTHVDSDDQGGEARKVWGDGAFVYLANGTGDLLSYSVDTAGAFTLEDTADPGTGTHGVWGDGRFVYAAASANGIHSYSVDAAGDFTHLDSDDQGDEAYGVWGDGTFVYLANGGGGIHVYQVNELGILTHLTYIASSSSSLGIWGDGTFVYLANGTTLRSYAMNAETDAYTDLDVGEGDLLDRSDIEQVEWLWLPPGTHQFNVVVDCDAGGSAEEVDVYATWWDTYVF